MFQWLKKIFEFVKATYNGMSRFFRWIFTGGLVVSLYNFFVGKFDELKEFASLSIDNLLEHLPGVDYDFSSAFNEIYNRLTDFDQFFPVTEILKAITFLFAYFAFKNVFKLGIFLLKRVFDVIP